MKVCFYQTNIQDGYSIIEKAQSQDRKKLDKDHPDYVYYEEHHILPRYMFPEYEDLRLHPWNGVLLNAREHYICHHLLCKMTNKNYQYKLLSAFNILNIDNKNNRRYTPKSYEYLKKNTIN